MLHPLQDQIVKKKINAVKGERMLSPCLVDMESRIVSPPLHGLFS